jgi:hypothetical protein
MIFGEAASQVSADIAQYWLLNVDMRGFRSRQIKKCYDVRRENRERS